MQARAGKLNTDEVLRVCESFWNETALIVWQDLLNNLSYITHLIQERRGPAAELEALRHYMQKLLVPIVKHLGWEPTPEEGTSFLCYFQ